MSEQSTEHEHEHEHETAGERYVARYETVWGPALVPVIRGRFTCGHCGLAFPIEQLSVLAFMGMHEGPRGHQVAVSQPRCANCAYEREPPVREEKTRGW